MGKASPTGGVKPMSIAGRFVSERERLFGMTDEERLFRKQWLKDQELGHSEPRVVPEMYKATHNPIRRFYRWPLNTLANVLRPALGEERTLKIRYFTGKIVIGIVAAYATTYYFKYHANDWTRYGGWRFFRSRESVVEGDPGYPRLADRATPSEYSTIGFEKNPLKW